MGNRQQILLLEVEQELLSAGLCAPFTPYTTDMPPGNLNYNDTFVTADKEIFILRSENSHKREIELPNIVQEYKGVAFLQTLENGFRLRTPLEQAQFAVELSEKGISVPEVVWASNEIQVIRYEPNAVSLADLWISGDPSAPDKTLLVLDYLKAAHSKQFVIGDRWGPNELITGKNQVMFVDFDIKIWGPEAKEFELANLIYTTSYFCQLNSENDFGVLFDVLSSFLMNLDPSTPYNIDILKTYISNYFVYFSTSGTYQWKDRAASLQFKERLLI